MLLLVLMPAKGSCSNVEIWLPERDKWNGRFVGGGNGGAGGHINPDGFIGSIRMGFASAPTDMGTAPAPDIGIGNPEVWKDFGFRSTHLMTVAAKQVIKAFYGKSPVYSYFLGHSTGGQQALQEAHNDTITLIGHSYGGDTAENAAHDTTRAIDKLITLDPVSFWDFDGSKPDSVNNWYNVIAEDDVYTWNDWIADVGGQWGEEYGAQNFVVETDHNNPLDMLNYFTTIQRLALQPF